MFFFRGVCEWDFLEIVKFDGGASPPSLLGCATETGISSLSLSLEAVYISSRRNQA